VQRLRKASIASIEEAVAIELLDIADTTEAVAVALASSATAENLQDLHPPHPIPASYVSVHDILRHGQTESLGVHRAAASLVVPHRYVRHEM